MTFAVAGLTVHSITRTEAALTEASHGTPYYFLYPLLLLLFHRPVARRRRQRRPSLASQLSSDVRGVVEPGLTGADILGAVTVHPAGRTMPAGLLDLAIHLPSEPWELPPCFRVRDANCDAVYLDLKGGNSEQVAFVSPANAMVPIFAPASDGAWHFVATLILSPACRDERDALIAGRAQAVPPPWPDIEVNGRRITLTPPVTPLTCGPPGNVPG